MSFLLSFMTLIQMFQVTWYDTNVDVELNDSIEDYVEIPYASLFDDGILVDTEVTYKFNGVNRTFLSTVQTSYVKVYAIDYEVYFPEYDIHDITTVYFNVIDRESPEFIYVPNYEMDVGADLPNLLINVLYQDNYDELEDMRLSVNDSYVNTDVIGRYPIYYYLFDSSNNLTTYEAYIDIYDHSGPIITLDKPLLISYGSYSIDYNEYFSIDDKESDQLSVLYDDHLVNYDHLGTYKFTVTAINESLVKTTKTFDLVIIDTVSPTLILKTNQKIDVFDYDKLNHLDDYILDIYDDYDVLTVSDVEISNDINIDEVGLYQIHYQVFDHSGNVKEETIEVLVVDREPPQILIDDHITLEVFDVEPIWKTYFEIKDNYDPITILDIEIEIDINMDKVGFYYMHILVTDKSKNIGSYEGYVEVVDRVSPEIEQINDIVITDFSEKTFENYFVFSDNYDDVDDLNFTVDADQVNYLKIGSYQIIVYCYDQSGNERELETYVYVIDTISPELLLTTTKLILPLHSKAINLMDYIYKVSDNYDQLNLSDVITLEEINYDQIGIYQVTYFIDDLSLNREEKSLYVFIDDLEKPQVSMTDIEIKLGEEPDYLLGIEVIDESSYEIIYDKTYIDVNKIGNQYLTYIIRDQRGNYTKYIRSFTISDESNSIDVESMLPSIVVFIAGILVIAYVIYKNK